mgnify:CR=1 FL=1
MKITEQFTEQQKQESLSITQANYIGDFAIRLFFSNGYQKLVDFKPFLEQATHPAIKKYLDKTLFKTYQIKDGNLDWNDFDLCFPLEDLYTNNLITL